MYIYLWVCRVSFSFRYLSIEFCHSSLHPPTIILTYKPKQVQKAEAAWNTRDPHTVSLAYTIDSHWRNRDEFLQGREAIKAFLTKKWKKEQDYCLMKELWTFHGNRISARFEYEWHDGQGQWYRSHGNEQWEFDEKGNF